MRNKNRNVAYIVGAWSTMVCLACGAPQAGPGTSATDLTGAKTELMTCPSGFALDATPQAKTDCTGSLGVQIQSSSGNAAVMCVNQAGGAYKCTAAESFAAMCAPNGLDHVTTTEVVCQKPR
jgi:hypothetical protein